MKTLQIITLASGLLILNACGGGSSTSTNMASQNSTPVQNLAPLINAGPDQNYTINESIILSITASDTDGSIQSYEWKEGNTVLSNNASFEKSDFSLGEHILTATVIDNNGSISKDTLLIKVGKYVQTSHQYYTQGDVLKSTSEFTYNQKGLIVKRSYDKDANGVVDVVTDLTYDQNGFISKQSDDNDANGVADRIRNYVNDDKGNKLVESYEFMADGHVSKKYTRTYDNNNRILSIHLERFKGGLGDYVYRFVYDNSGRLRQRTIDTKADGFINETDNYALTYTAAGYLQSKKHTRTTHVKNKHDVYATLDTESYTYDTNGNILVYANERKSDRRNVKIVRNTYDNRGNLIGTDTEKTNTGRLFQADSFIRYTYDEHNNLLSKTYDRNANFSPDTITKYTYDAHNNALSIAFDKNGNGQIDSTNKFTFTFIY